MLGGGRKPEDGKEETQRKKHVVYHVNSLLLNNNEIRDIKGLYPVLKEYVLFEPDRLQWLNLSYNYLVKIDADILDFSGLKPTWASLTAHSIMEITSKLTTILHSKCLFELQESHGCV